MLYERCPRSYFSPENMSEEESKVVENNYLEMVRLNDPKNLEELKDAVYSTKIKYDIWGLAFPLWGALGIPHLKGYYLMSREFYESKRVTNY